MTAAQHPAAHNLHPILGASVSHAEFAEAPPQPSPRPWPRSGNAASGVTKHCPTKAAADRRVASCAVCAMHMHAPMSAHPRHARLPPRPPTHTSTPACDTAPAMSLPSRGGGPSSGGEAEARRPGVWVSDSHFLIRQVVPAGPLVTPTPRPPKSRCPATHQSRPPRSARSKRNGATPSAPAPSPSGAHGHHRPLSTHQRQERQHWQQVAQRHLRHPAGVGLNVKARARRPPLPQRWWGGAGRGGAVARSWACFPPVLGLHHERTSTELD